MLYAQWCETTNFMRLYIGVSMNWGTPKSSILKRDKPSILGYRTFVENPTCDIPTNLLKLLAPTWFKFKFQRRNLEGAQASNVTPSNNRFGQKVNIIIISSYFLIDDYTILYRCLCVCLCTFCFTFAPVNSPILVFILWPFVFSC